MSATANPIKAALNESRPAFLGAFVFSLVINILMLAVPLYTLQVLDRVLSSGSKDTLLMLTVLVAVLLVFIGLLQIIRTLVFSHVGRWMDDKLSMDLLRENVELAIHKPIIGTQPFRDFATIKNFVSSSAMSSIFDAPWSIIYSGVIYLIHPTLGITVVLGAMFLLVFAIFAERYPSKRIEAANDSQIKSMQALDSMIRNAEVVRSMGLLEHASEKWRKHNQEALNASFSASNFNTVMNTSARTIRMGMQVLLVAMGAYFVLSAELSPGGIIAVSILANKALAPFDAVATIYHSWVGVKKAYERLRKMNQAVSDQKQTTRLPEPSGQLLVDKLSYQDKSSKRYIIRGIDFSIEPGEAVGIIGPSGSGKTTLARLLVGVLNPTAGEIRLDKAGLPQWNSDQLGGLLGYLPQDVELFSGTISDNIARLNSKADDAAIIQAANTAMVHETILQFPDGYKTEIGVNGALLSAGQRQRIGLARCFFGSPKVIVLDEPNANLDSDGEMALVQCLMNAKRLGITTVTIAHRPSVLQTVDKILVLQQGEVKLFGPRDEVISTLNTGGRKVQPLRTSHSKELSYAE